MDLRSQHSADSRRIERRTTYKRFTDEQGQRPESTKENYSGLEPFDYCPDMEVNRHKFPSADQKAYSTIESSQIWQPNDFLRSRYTKAPIELLHHAVYTSNTSHHQVMTAALNSIYRPHHSPLRTACRRKDTVSRQHDI